MRLPPRMEPGCRLRGPATPAPFLHPCRCSRPFRLRLTRVPQWLHANLLVGALATLMGAVAMPRATPLRMGGPRDDVEPVRGGGGGGRGGDERTPATKGVASDSLSATAGASAAAGGLNAGARAGAEVAVGGGGGAVPPRARGAELRRESAAEVLDSAVEDVTAAAGGSGAFPVALRPMDESSRRDDIADGTTTEGEKRLYTCLKIRQATTGI